MRHYVILQGLMWPVSTEILRFCLIAAQHAEAEALRNDSAPVDNNALQVKK